ncbi:MAG: phage holin family protein [Betaproteobacteria bacterium]|nr:phage holin family protein [Betaproteobacteria bacterium]
MQAPPHNGAPRPSPQGGLLHSLRTLLATLVATVRTRGELLQLELEEERLRVAGILVVAAAAAFFLSLAVLLFSFFLILLFWDTHRVWVSGLLAVAYLVIGIGCAMAARSRSRGKSKLFSASLAELRKDGERLTPSPPPPPTSS